jgi:hypothetical protein
MFGDVIRMAAKATPKERADHVYRGMLTVSFIHLILALSSMRTDATDTGRNLWLYVHQYAGRGHQLIISLGVSLRLSLIYTTRMLAQNIHT